MCSINSRAARTFAATALVALLSIAAPRSAMAASCTDDAANFVCKAP